jgi:Na+-transporting methylmalonyl-CoA/oxaloacetate decarboxylase gamma subunit
VKQVNDARRSVTEMFISGEQQKQVAKRKEGDGGQSKPAAAPKAAPAAAPQPDMNQGLQALAAAVMQMAQANQEAMREIAASIQQRP